MEGQLFSKRLFSDESRSLRNAIIEEIQKYDLNSILTSSTEELVNYFESRYSMKAPELRLDEKHLKDTPKEVISNERMRDPWGDGIINVNQDYIEFTVCIPFDGDASLLDIQPTSYAHNMSKQINATIQGQEIHLFYKERSKDSQTDFSSIYESDIGLIEKNIQFLTKDAEEFNRELPNLIRLKIEERKQIAEKNQSIIQSFKIPIKKREDIPETYNIPEIRRKPNIIAESQKPNTFTPEPALAIEEYENILNIVKDMALAMERSPETFFSLKEEDIRNFFLILLNGHYQGNATGETFNGNGKTDILIRHKNANVFIAECKFWKGQKELLKAIDQLLGYVTWRDTKVSIILFNKNPDSSSILAKSDGAIKQHKNFKTEYELSSDELKNNETILGYKFTHPSDPDKEVFLSLLVFQINELHV